MIATGFTELQKRRGPMVTLIVSTIGIPTAFLTIRLLLLARLCPPVLGPVGDDRTFNVVTVSVLDVAPAADPARRDYSSSAQTS